jgi:hypothetical protein
LNQFRSPASFWSRAFPCKTNYPFVFQPFHADRSLLERTQNGENMSNNYYDATGVLFVKKITPVIKALFGEFDVRMVGGIEAYIANLSEISAINWDEITDELNAMISQLGLSSEDGKTLSTIDAIKTLGIHFKVSDDPGFMGFLENFEQNRRFEDDPDLEDLYRLGLFFDDSHGLKGFRMQGAWTCDKPRIDEFGGGGVFRTPLVNISSWSNDAVSMGSALDMALAEGNFDKAAAVVYNHTNSILDGICDETSRVAVREMMSSRLQGDPSGMKWWAITGRIPRSEEDSGEIIQAATEAEARAIFRERMHEYSRMTPEIALEYTKVHGCDVYITSVFSSDTKIS